VVLRARPAEANAHFNFGCALLQQGRLADAAAAFRTCIGLADNHAPAWGNLGLALREAGRLEEAAPCLQRAASLQPHNADAAANCGIVLRALSRYAEAETAMRRAVALAPSNPDMLCHLGIALRELGRLTEAEAVLRAALDIAPADREAHVALALTLLLSGNLKAGWPEFTWRGAAAPGRARFSLPVWLGEQLDGTLLVYGEQGAGDFLQMCRYLPLLADRGLDVAVLPAPELRRLAATVRGVRVVESEPEGCVACCADLDLPGLFAVGLEDIPAAVPYLAAPAAEVAAWRARLAALPGRKVGLSWAGNPAYFHDRQRSIPAEALAAVAGMPDMTFVSLQPDPPQAASAALGLVDWTAELVDFAATAALIEALDLVIAVDSAVAHLAGALGRDVWLLNRYAPDWRWLLQRDDSPWYPSLRQFRQAEPGDWQDVLRRVRGALGG
jgi:Flp pilus assembly protein TadD